MASPEAKMDPKKIKEELGILTVELLDKHGMLKNGDLVKDVELYGTTDSYAEQNNEVMITASVNNKDAAFVLISNGKDNQEDDLQIDQIYIDKVKAALILTALLKSFPNLLDSVAVGQAIPTITENPDQKSLEIDFNLKNVNEVIGLLKEKIVELETFKKKGYSKLLASGVTSKTKTHILSFTKEKVTLKPSDYDSAIDLHLKNKEFAAQLEQGKVGTVDVYTRKNKTFYVSYSPESKAIKLIEANVQEQLDQKLDKLPIQKSTKYIVLDKLLAAKLYKAIRTAYPHVTDQVPT